MIGTTGAVTAALIGVESYTAWGGLILLPVVDGRIGFIPAFGCRLICHRIAGQLPKLADQ